MAKSLLPPNASALEKDLERIIESSTSLPVHIRDLWNPDTCPAELLPWLAWAYSVDSWSDHWGEHTKRRVVKNAYEVHRFKATPFAVQHALDGLGISANVTEWWEQNGSGTPGTMTVIALLNENLTGEDDGLITAEMLKLVTETVNTAKRGSIHFNVQLGIALDEEFALAAGCSPSYGVFDTGFNEQGVVPDEAEADLGTYNATHRIDCREHDAIFNGVLPEEFEIEGRLAGGSHQLVISDYSLMGVA